MNAKAILVVSFGSSSTKAREENLEPIVNRIRENYTEWEVVHAFTSPTIIRKLRTQGICFPTPVEALDQLCERGFTEIFVQPLHLLAGHEYDKVHKAIMTVHEREMTKAIQENKPIGLPQITLGKVLFNHSNDYIQVLDAIGRHMVLSEKCLNILIGHGTDHAAQETYEHLQTVVKKRGWPMLIGTIETGVQALMEKLSDTSSVHLIPLLLVAGEHVQEDILGNHPTSWISQLKAQGIEVTYYPQGLGENKKIQQLYIQHLEEGLNEIY